MLSPAAERPEEIVNKIKKVKQDRLGRRSFLHMAAATAAGVMTVGATTVPAAATTEEHAAGAGAVHTTCLGCNARCGMRVYVKDGKVRSVCGNPYHPYAMGGHPIPYDTPLDKALELTPPVCAKAHEAANYLYNPYRLRKPLKRAGERGSGRFEPIEWEQLIREVAQGGKLFAALGDTRDYPGIRSVLSDDPMDANAPELGSVRNGFIFIGGRDQSGYQDFTTRFVKGAVGSVNRISHTDICGLGFRMGNYALTEGKDVELKADPMACEYMLIFGANVYEALQPGINHYGALLAERHAAGQLRFVIVDPRATNASAHADRWLPVKPGQDGALSMGMIRVLLEEKLYDREFLVRCHDSTDKRGCTNATYLVITAPGHAREGTFLRWGDLHPEEKNSDTARDFVVMGHDGHPVPASSTETAHLEYAGSITWEGKPHEVCTAFALMRNQVMAHSLEEYAQQCGISATEIASVAREFAAHGHKAAVCQYHGAGNYVGGTWAAYAVAMLNVLVGSVNCQGGYLHGGGSAGAWKKGAYDLAAFSGQRKPAGVRISREGAVYEKSSEFRAKKAAGQTGYPARRPWLSYTKGGLCVEALNGIDQGYPYPCKVLFTFFFNPVYSIPGGQHYIPMLKDPDKVPLHVSMDICINESNLYADYIVPNLTYLEGQYAFMSPHAPALKFSTVRVPAVEALTGRTKDGRPYCMETFLIDLAEQLNLPGFGKDAIAGADGKRYPLHCAEDFYLRALANLAVNCQLPPADSAEMRHVETSVPAARYRHILTEDQWRRTCTLIARGGVFRHEYESLFKDGIHTAGLPRFALYNETLAQARNSMTGERCCGTLSLASAHEALGRHIDDMDAAYPFTAVTYKMNVHAQSRTSSHRWALEVFPENFLEMHHDDARELGISAGDRVRITSRSCPQGIVMRARPSSLLRRGVVAISFHYGHSQMGASDLEIQDVEQVLLGGSSVGSHNRMKGDPRLGSGGNFNELARLDTSLGDTPLVDPVGGIPDFSSTRVRIEKIRESL